MSRKRHENYCSFCGKRQIEVMKLVAGCGVFICNECIVHAYSLLDIPVSDAARRRHEVGWEFDPQRGYS